MKVVLWILLIVAILLAAGLVVVYTGTINIAATEPHAGFTSWLLDTVMVQSVRASADEVTVPELTEADVQSGALDFGVMCATCHGAPGIDRTEIGEGLNPTPPELSEAASLWSTAELFWIIKHGVRMTGMPAFGPTHSDDEIWNLAAFVEQMPEMTAAEYREMRTSMR